MLMIFLSEIAEWVLNKCALSKPHQTYDSNPTQFNEVFVPDERVASDDSQNSDEETDFGGRLERLLSTEGDYYTLMCVLTTQCIILTFSCLLASNKHLANTSCM